jgi:hypothetical protein
MRRHLCPIYQTKCHSFNSLSLSHARHAIQKCFFVCVDDADQENQIITVHAMRRGRPDQEDRSLLDMEKRAHFAPC